MFRLCSLLGLLALANSEESSEELEAEKPTLLKVVGADSKRPKDGLELRVLQRHGRAPLPPEPKHLPSSEDEMMQEFSEIIVEYKTNFYVSSIQVRLPEKQQQLPHSVIDFEGYKFFTGPNNECKFQLGDKSLLPDNDTQLARDMAGSGEISNCVADNSDTSDMKPRRSSALLKFHPHPFEHNASGWRYFSMMIRNAQTTPVRSSINGQEANTFQIVVNTPWETIAEMSFEALEIQQVWVCSYTPWFVTTPCTADCGGGFRTRVRRKLHANPEGYNPKLLKSCDENIEEHESCNTQECDVDCQLSEWTPWANGECSRSCGNGTMVERRNVVMGPKGSGKICPPWSAEGERVRVVPCNPNPCPASCTESSQSSLEEFQEMVKDSNSKLLVFKDIPQPGVRAIPEEAEAAEAEDEESEETEQNETKPSTKESDEEEESQQAQESEDQAASIGEGEDDSKLDDDATQSLLSTKETPATQFGLSKSSCSEPCGGGRRLVLVPSEQKVSSGKEDKSCYSAFEEDCNTFACKALMIQPATAWQFPVAGKWFMVDVEFVIEELAESLTLRAPPDFLLAATGESSECFLVEHSLPNLENCTVYPGQTSDKTGPIIVLDFSNPLEPQTSYTTKQDWYYMRFWVQHPEHCSGGKTADGRCLGLVGEREWTLSLKLSEPNSLWELVKGSYEIFVDEKWAKAAFEANAANNRPLTEEAQGVEEEHSASSTDGPDGSDGSDGSDGGEKDVPDAQDVKDDSLMESHEVRHHRGRHRKHSKGRWRS